MNGLAEQVTLHLIMGTERPKGVSDEIYEECINEFEANRGRFEWERDSVKKVLCKYGLEEL